MLVLSNPGGVGKAGKNKKGWAREVPEGRTGDARFGELAFSNKRVIPL